MHGAQTPSTFYHSLLCLSSRHQWQQRQRQQRCSRRLILAEKSERRRAVNDERRGSQGKLHRREGRRGPNEHAFDSAAWRSACTVWCRVRLLQAMGTGITQGRRDGGFRRRGVRWRGECGGSGTCIHRRREADSQQTTHGRHEAKCAAATSSPRSYSCAPPRARCSRWGSSHFAPPRFAYHACL